MGQSLAHTKWMCKYHIVFTPKFRRKIVYGQYRESVGEILRRLCSYKGVEIIEGHLMTDHVHKKLGDSEGVCWENETVSLSPWFM